MQSFAVQREERRLRHEGLTLLLAAMRGDYAGSDGASIRLHALQLDCQPEALARGSGATPLEAIPLGCCPAAKTVQAAGRLSRNDPMRTTVIP